MKLILIDRATREEVDRVDDWQNPMPQEGEQIMLDEGAGYLVVVNVVWDLNAQNAFLFCDIQSLEQPEQEQEEVIEEAVQKAVKNA